MTITESTEGPKITARFLCKGCIHSPESLNPDGKIQCGAAQFDIEPILKKKVKRFEDCPFRKTLKVHVTGCDSQKILKALSAFARRLRKRVGSNDSAFNQILDRAEARLRQNSQ